MRTEKTYCFEKEDFGKIVKIDDFYLSTSNSFGIAGYLTLKILDKEITKNLELSEDKIMMSFELQMLDDDGSMGFYLKAVKDLYVADNVDAGVFTFEAVHDDYDVPLFNVRATSDFISLLEVYATAQAYKKLGVIPDAFSIFKKFDEEECDCFDQEEKAQYTVKYLLANNWDIFSGEEDFVVNNIDFPE